MQPIQSIEPIEPDHAMEPIVISEHDYAMQPVEISEHDYVMQPAELVDTVQSVESSDVIQPIQPVEPVEQSQPSHQTVEQNQLSECNVEMGQQAVHKQATYPSNIMKAIRSSGKQWVKVEEIYDFYYKMNPACKNLDKTASKKWKSSIRHALSSSAKFVQREVTAGSDRVKQKRFQYAINPDLDKGKKAKKQKKAMPATEFEF
ncbi:uncharacterized protein LOC119077185 [Bradysia coprophila]|uniref:uncharacterized protein LOC119077185 n=1 Tax=Bradysia coprophila TaxID=38358 RepID=UPI00187D8BB7|nr:uncharacterized protein LOC119077185 [Bradysia coprophila]